MTDLHAAREAAERMRKHLQGESKQAPCFRAEDQADLADFAVAVLADPAILLPAAKWDQETDYQFVCRTAHWVYVVSKHSAHDNWWWQVGSGCYQPVPSLSAAQAACEEDMRERIRRLFRAEK